MAFEGAAITVERGNADQSQDLLAIEFSQFWELGEQGAAGDRTDAGNSSE